MFMVCCDSSYINLNITKCYLDTALFCYNFIVLLLYLILRIFIQPQSVLQWHIYRIYQD